MQTKLVLKQQSALKLRFAAGATGPAGTVTVNPTTITGAAGTDASVTNTGTPTAAILQFTIPRGNTGATGDDGWSPILAVVTDGDRRVLQLSDWTGGEGTKPAAGSYIGASGLVSAIGDAVDIRGAQGPAGSVTDGDKGDIVVSGGGGTWTIDTGAVGTAKIADDAVTFDKTQNIATGHMLGRKSAGSGNIEELTAADSKQLIEPPGGHLFGLTLTNNATDASNDIDIAAGEAASDDAAPALLVLAAAATKRLDAAWAVGTNQGGLDTGAIAANSTYHVFLIRRPDTGVVDALFSLSATAPTMPANYTQKRRIGAVRTGSGSAIIPFKQSGDDFLLVNKEVNVNVTNPGTSAVLRTLSVPIGIKVTAIVNVEITWLTSGNGYHLVTSPDEADEAPAAGTGAMRTVAGSSVSTSAHRLRVRTDTSGRIRTRHSTSGATNDALSISTVGWVDTRGRV